MRADLDLFCHSRNPPRRFSSHSLIEEGGWACRCFVNGCRSKRIHPRGEELGRTSAMSTGVGCAKGRDWRCAGRYGVNALLNRFGTTRDGLPACMPQGGISSCVRYCSRRPMLWIEHGKLLETS